MPPLRRYLLLASLFFAAGVASARRSFGGADGTSVQMRLLNPYHDEEGAVSDQNVIDITTKCPRWAADPVRCPDDAADAKALLPRALRRTPLHVTFRPKELGASGKRKGWMRATAHLGDPDAPRAKAVPLRAVWTLSNVDAEGATAGGPGAGRDSLTDSYEDCLLRLHKKFVELEVLLPRGKGRRAGTPRPGLAPPSLVYRVPIQPGHVNPMGMVAQGRATVTLYPRGRTLAAAGAGGRAGRRGSRGAAAPREATDTAIRLGMVDFHLPRGPGLVDPGWAKGRKVFWKGRKLGVV